MSGSLISAFVCILAISSCSAVSLRGTGWFGAALDQLSRHIQAPAGSIRTSESRVTQTSADAQSRTSEVLDVYSEAAASQAMAANSCLVKDLLAWSDNVYADTAGAVAVDEHVVIKCLPGFLPPPGRTDSATVKCLRRPSGEALFDTESSLNCGLPCQNRDLSSPSGMPLDVGGITPPLGHMEMECALSGMLPVTVRCMPDGTWATRQPCMPCDTSVLRQKDQHVQLSAHGMVMPLSQIQMTCPSTMYAYPVAKATVFCQPGGTWSSANFKCSSHGCDTADFVPGELAIEFQGRLAVGARVMVRQVQNVHEGLAVGHFSSTCQANGLWSQTEAAVDADWYYDDDFDLTYVSIPHV